MVFDQPTCPASYPTQPSLSHSNVAHEHVHNEAFVYLAVAVATFAAVPSFIWLRDRQHSSRERRRNRVVAENIKAKMDGAEALDAVPAAPVLIPESSSVDVLDEERDSEGVKDRKKRTKDRRKRNKDPPMQGRSRRAMMSSRASPMQRDVKPTNHTPRAPEQSSFSSSCMPDIASPMPMSLIVTSFHSPTSSPAPSRSENSSQTGRSRSASASSTTTPLTPSSLPHSNTLPNVISKVNNTETWALYLPHDDPAWDWDGQSSTYSSGSRAPSSSSSIKPARAKGQPSPHTPESASMPSAPSLVFPSLDPHPPPRASLSTQIASLKRALEASRTREGMHRRDAERWSKECDIIKWKWSEANDEWRRREAELQLQIHHLLHQMQTFTHTASSVPSATPLSFAPGQPPFPLPMPFPLLHHPLSPFINGSIHSFHSNPTSHSNRNDTVNEGLAEAILKRPSSVQPYTTPSSRSRSGESQNKSNHGPYCAQVTSENGEIGTSKIDVVERVVEFEFPTLVDRRVVPSFETVANVDGVEIFH